MIARTCPVCGTALTDGAPDAPCPVCLMKLGLESWSSRSAADPVNTPTELAGDRFDAPEIDALQPRLPHLELLELLGKGGMGAVYKARQTALDRLVAVKIINPRAAADPNFAERFSREARSLARLNHPHIVTVHDFGELPATDPGDPPLFYFVMEYVEGANLRELIRSKRLEPPQALGVIPAICDALQYAHDEGIVHRDIKPENILVDRKGRVKIADFGLAKLLGRGTQDVALTGAYQAMGTLHYMAPEQFERPLEVDHRADIYSLGVTLYELLTGELPLGRFAPPSQKVQVDVRLDEVVLKTLEREPGRRYQHASEVKTDLEMISGVSMAALGPMFGHEFRSKTMLFGLPLVHIASGVDPRTGRPRVAKGIIAIGDRAVGGVAIGGGAVGGIAIGGAAIGLVSLGGLSIGILTAIGGMAIGGLAFGGGALGPVAIGGMAIGWYAFGGEAFGMHVLSSTVQEPEALRFFESWAQNWSKWLMWLGIGMPLGGSVLAVLIWLALALQSRRDAQTLGASSTDRGLVRDSSKR
jgi:tRNA A-37 threonylcarbamoyl transferase component Bud32